MNWQSLRIVKKKVMARLKDILTSIPDSVKLLFKSGPYKQQNRQYIIFVGNILPSRIPRMAKWLKRQSTFNLVLLCRQSGFINSYINEDFDSILLYRNKFHLLSLLKEFDPQKSLVHSFGPPCEDPAYALRKFKGKSIYDYQDLLVINFGLNAPFPYMRKGMQHERYLLENADCIVSHSLEMQAAKKLFPNFSSKSNILFFPNYTDNDAFIDPPKKSIADTEDIHIVYAGGIMSSYRNSDYFGGLQFHWLIDKLERQKIHFHIYPSPTLLKEHIVDYYELDESHEYFHLHPSVKGEDLSKEMSQYHFGILPFFHRTNKVLNEKRDYATTLKMYNYFEAGLPILLAEDLGFQNFIAGKYQAGIKLSYDDFDAVRSKIKEIDYNAMVNSLLEKRAELSLKYKIKDLIDKYHQLFDENASN